MMIQATRSVLAFATSDRTKKYLSVALIALLVVTWGATYVIIQHQEQKALDSAALRSKNLDNYFESRTEVTFRYVDDYIKTIRRIFLQNGSLIPVQKFMADISPNTAIISHITIMDSYGAPLFSSAGQTDKIKSGAHVRDREYFKFQKASRFDSVYISVVRKERNTGLNTLLLVRRITSREGAFNGLIFAAVKASQLLNFSGTMLMKKNSSMTLVGLDKQIRLRRSQNGLDGIGKKIGESKLWKNMMKSDAGYYRQTSIIDKVTRLWTYRKVNGFPVIAVIGSAYSDTLGALINVRRFIYTVAALISVIGITTFFLAHRAIAITKLEAANKAKSEFMTIMSHELRTPLNAINGFSEMMHLEMLGPRGNQKYTEYAGNIHSAGKHLLQVINDLLDISKIEVGAQKLEKENINVMEMVKSSVELVRGRAQKANVELPLDIPNDFPALFADRLRLKQILLNLLTNAIKFTPEKGRVTVRATVDGNGAIILQVQDTGIGIAPDDIPKVFEPFGQVDSGMGRNQEGTGLGIPLTKALMELHGGSLEIESEVGNGTTVTARFPPESSLAIS